MGFSTIRHCLLCASDRAEVVETFPDPKANIPLFSVLKCSDCGLLYTDPQPSLEVIAQYYEEDYSSWHLTSSRGTHFGSAWHRWTFCHHFGYPQFCDELPFFKRLFTRAMSYFHSETAVVPRGLRGGRLLDVGCGSGQFLGLMAHLGWSVTGVEPSPKACQMAAARWGIKPINGWIEDVKDGSFDVVSMIGVIEHLHDPLDALRKVRQLLGPNGSLLLTTHDIPGPGPRLFGKKWVGWEVPQHLYFFDRSTMTSMLKKAGFKSVNVTGHFRSIDLFNTVSPGRKEKYATFFLSRAFKAIGLAGGMIVEAR